MLPRASELELAIVFWYIEVAALNSVTHYANNAKAFIMQLKNIWHSPVSQDRARAFFDLMQGSCQARSAHLLKFSVQQPLQSDFMKVERDAKEACALMEGAAAWCFQDVKDDRVRSTMWCATPLLANGDLEALRAVLVADASKRADLMQCQTLSFFQDFITSLSISASQDGNNRYFFPKGSGPLNLQADNPEFIASVRAMLESTGNDSIKHTELLAPLALATPIDAEAAANAATVASSETGKTAVSLLCSVTRVQILTIKACMATLSKRMQASPLATSDWVDAMKGLSKGLAEAEPLSGMVDAVFASLHSMCSARGDLGETSRDVVRALCSELQEFLCARDGHLEAHHQAGPHEVRQPCGRRDGQIGEHLSTGLAFILSGPAG